MNLLQDLNDGGSLGMKMERRGGRVLGQVLEQAQEVEQEAGLVRQQEVQNHARVAGNGLKVN